ncbi:HCP-like protein [Dacryopinax primogenitus]|uniref:HCP-like protein n=1 Tax=Dacryopinax primogenitus (strain DJM 731) TaxID=1858805 RepID=M5GBE6_DACPD|nr:HCP-like protein [Dacryopinax primogenitus]EJU05700.1 HCP-like protein [Dacryopinax primogenitus]
MYGQPQAYAQPVQPDPLYAAASDLLGLPPGAQPARMPGIPGGSQYSGNSAQSSNSSTLAVPSAGLPLPRAPSPGLQRGPTTGGATGLQRSTTSASSITTLNTRKTKAIDLNQPPFTREYIEQYRARIKVDPDPEAHFQFAKYLIEAAKKVGAHAPDQKAVLRYRTGLISEALKVIKKLATSADPLPDAQFFLATCYGTGMLGLQIDHEKSYQFYVAAAKLRHPAASYRVAVCNELGAGTKRDLSRAVAFYRQAASLGDTPAMYKLGMVLLTPSLGQKKDEKEAVKWLRRAAEQADEENPHGLHELGLLHETGECSIVPKDEACARELFTRGGNLGYTKSCLKLGACYEYGALTCPVDPKRSIAWYTRAAEKNDPEAELALSGWYLTGCESVLKQSDHEAYLWARRAANKGLPKAEYAVGYYAEVGIGIKPDIEFAKKWYLRAAAQGHQRSKERLTQLKMASSKRLGLTRPTRQQAKDECVIM